MVVKCGFISDSYRKAILYSIALALLPNQLHVWQVEVLSVMPVVSKNGNDTTLESALNHVLLS